MACEKETACFVRGYHVYKDIWAAAIGEVLVCSREPNKSGKIFVVKYIRVKYVCTFSLYKNIFATKYKQLRYSLLTAYIILFDSRYMYC